MTGTPPGRLADGPPGDVIQADAGDAEPLAHLIAQAFHDLAPSRWLIPDPGARRAIFPACFRLLVEHAMEAGTVHTNADRTATALWIPTGPTPLAPPAGYTARLAAVTGPWAERFTAFDATLSRHHLTGVAHCHLAILAVHPHKQGHGLGTMLLRARHQVLDDHGVAAYLEASSHRSRRLYLRHGYTPLPGAPFHLPDAGPPMWPMVRLPPRPSTSPASPPAPATTCPRAPEPSPPPPPSSPP